MQMLPASGVGAAVQSRRGAPPIGIFGAACVEWWYLLTSRYCTLGAGNACSAVAGRKSVYNLVQATGSLQPIWDAAGYLKFDASNDYMTFTLTAEVSQGQLYIDTRYGWHVTGVADWAAVQHRLCSADVRQIIFIDASAITTGQRAALQAYLGARQYGFITKTLDTTIYNRLDNTTNIDRTISYIGNNGATYNLASSQAGATINVGDQGLTAPVHMLLPATVLGDTALLYFNCYNNQLTGSIPSLTANTALREFYCENNQLTGAIPSLTANTALQIFNCHSNQLTGSIPSLTANTALREFYCYINKLTGSIPSLTANTALQLFNCYNNQLTGSIPSLTANTALQYFNCHDNQLTGAIPSLTANTALQYFYCYNNQLTAFSGGNMPATLVTFNASNNLLTAAAVNAILAAFVAGGGASGSITLNGTDNAAPTGQGIIDKATLQGLGWTVNTN